MLFRVGDFYETIKEDAVTISKELGVVLTKNNNGIDLAGFPAHAFDINLQKLIRSGYKVAICDQLEEPKKKRQIHEI